MRNDRLFRRAGIFILQGSRNGAPAGCVWSQFTLPVVRWRLGVVDPTMTVVGVHFRNELQASWNAPMSFVDLELPGVVKLDTSVVPDVLGLKAFYDDAAPVRPRMLSESSFRMPERNPGVSTTFRLRI